MRTKLHLLCAILIAFSATSCMRKLPERERLSATEFDHTGFEASCIQCHEPNRPSPTHNPGVDCVNCHTPGGGWTNLRSFSHVPVPASCTRCHESARPAQTQFPAPGGRVSGHFGSQDCVACHQAQSSTISRFVFGHRDAKGRQVPTCLPCHEAKRPTPTHNAGQDCAKCHIEAGTSWAATGSPHPANDPRPTSCANCHSSSRPTTTQYPAPGPRVQGHFGTEDCYSCHNPKTTTLLTFAFDHRANGQAQSECLPCHAAKRPTTVVNRFSHATAGTGDCAACHQNQGGAWNDGQYSHSPAPTTCASCHAGDRPTTVVNRFSHALAGTGECASCHRSPGATWSDGTYTHSPRPTACATCHEGDRPSPTHNAGRDCVQCHNQPGVSWSGTTFSHSPPPTSCNNCHLSDRPSNDTRFTIPGGPEGGTFTHGQGRHPNTDCVRCHNRPGESWVISSPATVCASCH